MRFTPGLRGRRVRRPVRVCRFFWTQKESGPPKPNPKFTRQDIKRIKQHGPTMEDLTLRIPYKYTTPKGVVIDVENEFTPESVLGRDYTEQAVEPKWDQMPKKSFNLFFHGIRERNWTSEHYNPKAPRWHIQFWTDSGRFMLPSFPGYRAVVTEPDGRQFWVNLHHPGKDVHTEDRLAGAGLGGAYNFPREQIYSGFADEYGYNQVFDELFEAREEMAPKWVREVMAEEDSLFINRDVIDMDKHYETYNPAYKTLAVEFQSTPPAPYFGGLFAAIPSLLMIVGSLSFVFVTALLGIFRSKRNKEPSDIQEALEFAQSNAKARKDATTGVTLADVAGLEGVKHQFEEVVDFLRDPKKYQESGLKPPKGVLLEGSPGTGKTLIAKAIAGEAKVGFYQMSGAEFVEAIVGVGAARVRDLFKRARAYDEPVLIFIDEIDALGLRRAQSGEPANEEREQTLNQLLTEIDGFQPTTGVVFIAATNRMALLDPALMRAGRFDRKISVPIPDAAARHAILQVHAKRFKLGEDVDLQQLAKDVPGLVGADLANLLNEAALEAVRRQATVINEHHLQTAMDRVLTGDLKPQLSTSTVAGQKLARTLAVHEAGRALCAVDMRRRDTELVDDVELVSMVRRGSSLTRTLYLRGVDDSYLLVTKKQLLARLRLHMAGHAAEEVLGLEATTYSAADFQTAGTLADLMVQNYGMSDIGLTVHAEAYSTDNSFKEGKSDVSDLLEVQLLDAAADPGLGGPMGPMIHKYEVARMQLLHEAYNDVKSRLTELRPVLEQVAEELLEAKELPGARLHALLENGPTAS